MSPDTLPESVALVAEPVLSVSINPDHVLVVVTFQFVSGTAPAESEGGSGVYEGPVNSTLIAAPLAACDMPTALTPANAANIIILFPLTIAFSYPPKPR